MPTLQEGNAIAPGLWTPINLGLFIPWSRLRSIYKSSFLLGPLWLKPSPLELTLEFISLSVQ